MSNSHYPSRSERRRSHVPTIGMLHPAAHKACIGCGKGETNCGFVVFGDVDWTGTVLHVFEVADQRRGYDCCIGIRGGRGFVQGAPRERGSAMPLLREQDGCAGLLDGDDHRSGRVGRAAGPCCGSRTGRRGYE